MKPKYIAQRIKDTTYGWLVTETDTGEKKVVFCAKTASSAEDAVNIIEDLYKKTDD
mgnify:CR=1 FL=1